MSRVKGSLPNLVGGISQQSPALRRASQAEHQKDAASSIVDGLTKRAPTHHRAKLSDGSLAGAFVHTINRDNQERYHVVIKDGVIRVWDSETGEEKVVNVRGEQYLNTIGSPRDAFRALTIADHTFILNTERVVQKYEVSHQWVLTLDTVEAGVTYEITAGFYYSTFAPFAKIASYTAQPGDTGADVAEGLRVDYEAENGTMPIQEFVTAVGNVFTLTADSGISGEMAVVFETFGGTGASVYTLEPQGHAEHSSSGMFYVKQGNYGTTYKLAVECDEPSVNSSYSVEYTTSNTDVTTLDTGFIATQLRDALVALTGFTDEYIVTAAGPSAVVMARFDNLNYTIAAKDSNGGRNMIAAKDTIPNFTDLPSKLTKNFPVKVTGDSGAEDDYYVEFETQDNIFGEVTDGVWREGARRGLPVEFDANTMPHLLVREADGTFTFKSGDTLWSFRQAGDEQSNQDPSFVGKTIQDVFFFRNRLGFVSDDKPILSEAGEFFNFYRKTVQALLDSDRIDVTASSTQVAKLLYGVPADERLVLFAEQNQFTLRAGEILTPKTVSVHQVLGHVMSSRVKPVAVGRRVYFACPKGTSTEIRELVVDKTLKTAEAPNITSHVPSLIPAGVFKLAASAAEGMLLALAEDAPSKIFVYRFHFQGEEKMQASWSHYELGEGVSVLDAAFVGSRLCLIVEREDGTYLECMNVGAEAADSGLTFEVLLDRRITEAQCSRVYNATADVTEITLPYEESGNVVAVVRGDSGEYRKLGTLNPTRTGADSFTVEGDVSAVPLWVGRSYTMEHEFSELFHRWRDPVTQVERVSTGKRLQIMRAKLHYSQTGYFRVEVTNGGRTFSKTFTTFTLGDSRIGQTEVRDGEFEFAINAKSDRARIRIINDSHLPSRFQSLEWRGILANPKKEVRL